jgi:hypothetical protein
MRLKRVSHVSVGSSDRADIFPLSSSPLNKIKLYRVAVVLEGLCSSQLWTVIQELTADSNIYISQSKYRISRTIKRLRGTRD